MLQRLSQKSHEISAKHNDTCKMFTSRILHQIPGNWTGKMSIYHYIYIYIYHWPKRANTPTDPKLSLTGPILIKHWWWLERQVSTHLVTGQMHFKQASYAVIWDCCSRQSRQLKRIIRLVVYTWLKAANFSRKPFGTAFASLTHLQCLKISR